MSANALPPLVTRKAALAAGLPSYFMAVPCVRGHVAPKRTRDGSCRQCQRGTPSRARRRKRRELDRMLLAARERRPQ